MINSNTTIVNWKNTYHRDYNFAQILQIIVLVMQYLNTILGLLSKTSSRDTVLRLVQYLTLHSVDQIEKGATFNIYTQMRRTRKVLRFLKTIQHSSQIRKELASLDKEFGNFKGLILKVLGILEHLFTVLFFFCDHRVFLGDLEVISKQNVAIYYPRSMKMYRLQNIFGALKSLMHIVLIFIDGKHEGKLVDMQKAQILIKKYLVEFIRNVLDVSIASYYLNKPVGKAKIFGVVGVITSLIGIGQALGKI